MSELSTPEWNAKIVKALKEENSRRFAGASKTAATRPATRARRNNGKARPKKAVARRKA